MVAERGPTKRFVTGNVSENNDSKYKTSKNATDNT